MKIKYKIQQEVVRGDLVYCGYRYILWLIPWFIYGSLSFDRDTCEQAVKKYHYYYRKPWYKIFWLE